MTIYVVQSGDTIKSIADKYQVSETRLILDNGIKNPNDLVIGQTIVIAYPQEVYRVNEGDTLSQIAEKNGITLMELYRNNSFLWDTKYIYPGEELIISYNRSRTVDVNAYAFPFINKDILNKSLPYLTYLSVYNYKTIKKGGIESYYDDSLLISTAKKFGVAPLMFLSSISFMGEKDPEMIYEILLNPDYQDNHAESMIKILKEKGFYGVNITVTFLNTTNQELYLNYFKKIAAILNKEGYPVFITLDPNFYIEEAEESFEKVNYQQFNELVHSAIIMRFFWGSNYGPPMPVSSIASISSFVTYSTQLVDADKLNIGFPLLGYDWKLPYIKNFSKANAISLDTCIDLARTTKSTILFDDASQTPYFEYTMDNDNHIVWFVDARTLNEINNLVSENKLQGMGVWNIMNYYAQLWLVINSSYKINKILPETNLEDREDTDNL